MLRIELEPGDLVVDELLRVCAFAFGNVCERCLEGGHVRVGLAAGHLHERVDVLRVGVVRVPGRGRDRDAARTASRPDGGSKIPLTTKRFLAPLSERHLHRRSDVELVPLRIAVVDESAVAPSSPSVGCEPFDPRQPDHRPSLPGRRRWRRSSCRTPDASPRADAADAVTPGAFAAAWRRRSGSG